MYLKTLNQLAGCSCLFEQKCMELESEGASISLTFRLNVLPTTNAVDQRPDRKKNIKPPCNLMAFIPQNNKDASDPKPCHSPLARDFATIRQHHTAPKITFIFNNANTLYVPRNRRSTQTHKSVTIRFESEMLRGYCTPIWVHFTQT